MNLRQPDFSNRVVHFTKRARPYCATEHASEERPRDAALCTLADDLVELALRVHWRCEYAQPLVDLFQRQPPLGPYAAASDSDFDQNGRMFPEFLLQGLSCVLSWQSSWRLERGPPGRPRRATRRPERSRRIVDPSTPRPTSDDDVEIFP
jgi:hypothetical protein